MTRTLVLASALALLVGCSKQTEAPSADPVQKDGAPTVKVGALIPLSGKKAKVGMQQKRALELAQEKLGEYGVAVEFLYEDTQSEAKVGEAGARRLIAEQKVPFLFAFPCAVVYKTQPVADEAGALLMAGNMDPVTAGKSPRTFRVFPNLNQQNAAILEHLGEGGGKRAAVIRLDAPAPNNAMKQLLPALKKKGWHIAADVSYPNKDRAYGPVMVKVKDAKADVILMYVDNEAVPPLLKMMKADNSLSGTKIIGGISFSFPYKLPPEVFEGVHVAAPKCALSGRPALMSSWLGTEFKKRHGKPPHIFAAFAYDSAMLLGSALKQSDGSPTNVQGVLSSTKDNQGATGLITIDEAGNAQVEWGIGVYRGGKLLPVGGK